MAALPMMITDIGRDAIVDAQTGGTEAVLISEVGLTATPFDIAPTITNLPGEFRRLATVSGQAASETIIHVTAYDPAAITYDVTGFGLYADDGTLVAVYSSDGDPILSKAVLATALLALDIAFSSDVAAVIEFGDALFLNPPSTEETAGVIKIATEAMADEAADEGVAMTPALVKRMIDNALRGKIAIWSGAIVDIEPGWQLCDGTNGTPDLRDVFVVGAGVGYAVGNEGGAAMHDHGGNTGDHVLTIAEMPSHDHPNGVGDQIATSFVYGSVAGASVTNMNNDSDAGTMQGLTGPRGGGQAHNHAIAAASNLPPYYALAYIMKV
jgi:hypothetical protein